MSNTQPGQRAFEVAYLGPPGTFSHQVALGLYPDHRDNQPSSSKVTLIPYDTITQAADSILSASTPRRLALLPLKNSTHGIVKETEEFLASSPVPVETIKTVALAVRHALLVNSKTYERLQQVKDSDRPLRDEALKSIEKVYSHEQVRLCPASHSRHPSSDRSFSSGPWPMSPLSRLAPPAHFIPRRPHQRLKHSVGRLNDKQGRLRHHGCCARLRYLRDKRHLRGIEGSESGRTGQRR